MASGKARKNGQKFPNLGVVKRTKQIDDNREVIIQPHPNGDIWTKAGDLDMSGDDKSHLSHNLRADKLRASIEKMVEEVENNAAAFINNTFLGIAPENVVDSFYNLMVDEGDKGDLFAQWVNDSGWSFFQDGLTTVVKMKGKVVGEMTAKVDQRFAEEVKFNILARQHANQTRAN